MPDVYAHTRRRERLAAALREQRADAMLVTRLANIRYLTGFTGSHAALLVPAGGGASASAALATDARYRLQAAEEAADAGADLELVIERDTARSLVARAVRRGSRAIAVESHDITVDDHHLLAEAITDAGGGDAAELVPVGRLVEAERTIKDEAELELLREACRATDWAFRCVVSTIRPGTTEREISVALQGRFAECGADTGFEPVVAAGPNAAHPHHHPTDRPLVAGDLLVMDLGARYHGYHADMTRTVAVGKPAGWQRYVYDLVAEAHQAGRAALRPGTELGEVDEAARAGIRAGGYGENFVHGLGHGVGLEIHEHPYIGPSAAGKLPAGAPVTVEPGVYLAGHGGVRIEDTFLPSAEAPEPLTRTGRELLVL